MSLEALIIDLTKAINRNTNTLLSISGASVAPTAPIPATEAVKVEPVKKGRAKPIAKPAPAPVIEENFVEEDEPTITKEQLAVKITKAVSLNKAAVIEYMKPRGYTKVDLIPEKEYADVLDFLDETIEAATKQDDGEDFSFGEE